MISDNSYFNGGASSDIVDVWSHVITDQANFSAALWTPVAR